VLTPIEKQWVVVGLGNPGKEYELTRHNMGYLVVQAFADELKWNFKTEDAFCAKRAKGGIEGVTTHLLLPLTYMNLSGHAVKAYLDFYKLTPEQLIVVTDDVALPFGEMRKRDFGGTGGHNGLKSIQASLQTQNYVRLRLGIGCDKAVGQTLADYVLQTFNSEEREKLPLIIQQGVLEVKKLLN